MPRDRTGKYIISTNVTAIDVRKLDPRSERERQLETAQGPLYRIVASLNMYQEALHRKAEIMRAHENRCRVTILPSRQEFELMGSGNAEVRMIESGVEEEEGEVPQPDV